MIHTCAYGLSITYKIRFFQQISILLILQKPHKDLNLVTSIRFQKNLRTSPKKLTYDNFGAHQ